MRQAFMSSTKVSVTSRGMTLCLDERSTWASWRM